MIDTLKFLAAILSVQAITVVLVLVIPVDFSAPESLLKLAVPLVAIGTLAAFWFGTLARHATGDKINRLRSNFADEREKLRVNAERAKTRIIKQNYRETARINRKVEIKSNIKTGMAFTAAIGIGLVMVTTQFMTLGLLTLTAAGSALGGYMFRARRENYKRLSIEEPTPTLTKKVKHTAQKRIKQK